MYRTFAIGTLTELSLSTSLLAATSLALKSIDVDVELEAIANPKAAASRKAWSTV